MDLAAGLVRYIRRALGGDGFAAKSQSFRKTLQNFLERSIEVFSQSYRAPLWLFCNGRPKFSPVNAGLIFEDFT